MEDLLKNPNQLLQEYYFFRFIDFKNFLNSTLQETPGFYMTQAVVDRVNDELANTVSDQKKAPWQKNGSVFLRFLAVRYNVAFDV